MIRNRLENYFIAFNNSLAADDVLNTDKEKLLTEYNKFLEALTKLKQEYNFDVLESKSLQNKYDLENNTRKMRYNYFRIITDAIYYANVKTNGKYYDNLIEHVRDKYHINIDTEGEQYNICWHDSICTTTDSCNHIWRRSDNKICFEDLGESFYLVAPDNINLEHFVKDLEEYCKVLNTEKDANEYQKYLRLKEKYEKQA